MEKILVATDEFNGRYVAMKSVDDNTMHIYPLISRNHRAFWCGHIRLNLKERCYYAYRIYQQSNE